MTPSATKDHVYSLPSANKNEMHENMKNGLTIRPSEILLRSEQWMSEVQKCSTVWNVKQKNYKYKLKHKMGEMVFEATLWMRFWTLLTVGVLPAVGQHSVWHFENVVGGKIIRPITESLAAIDQWKVNSLQRVGSEAIAWQWQGWVTLASLCLMRAFVPQPQRRASFAFQ